MNIDRALSQLTYNLAYPGVLGSMIFDLADPFRGISMIWYCSALIGLCFVADYVHLTINLCPDGRPKHVLQPVVDLVIAALFCLSYFSVARISIEGVSEDAMRTGLLFSMIFLFCAHVLIVLYDIALRQIRSLIDILPLLISGTGAALIWFELTALSPVVLVTGAAGAVFASYVLRLVSIDLRRASENAPA